VWLCDGLMLMLSHLYRIALASNQICGSELDLICTVCVAYAFLLTHKGQPDHTLVNFPPLMHNNTIPASSSASSYFVYRVLPRLSLVYWSSLLLLSYHFGHFPSL